MNVATVCENSCNIGLWCNGSTTLFGGVGTSSNLVRPTIGIGHIDSCCFRLYVNID